MPLDPYKDYSHNVTLGIDYKHFTNPSGELDFPISYLPFSVAYSASLPDQWGYSQFSANLKMAFRGLVTDQTEFEENRYRATGNYLYGTLGIERLLQLPAGMGLFLKVDGQLADQPLINNEQYAAGGMANVRGYLEATVLGDNAIHWTVELMFPDPLSLFSNHDWIKATPYAFYDGAFLGLKDPLPEQQSRFDLQGIGIGVKGLLLGHVAYQLDWGFALSAVSTPSVKNGIPTIVTTQAGTSRVHFQVAYQF